MIKHGEGWKNLPIGGIIDEGGTSVATKTGAWRAQKPIWDGEKCINCLRCFFMCPDSAIKEEDGKVVGIDYDYCKGCGICAHECPDKVSAISMEIESK